MAEVFRPPIVARRVVALGAAASREPARWHNQLTTTLRSRDKFFGPEGMGAEYHWPNPILHRDRRDLRTWLGPVDLTLVGKDKFFGAPGQPPQYEVRNPSRRSVRVELYGWLQAGLREVAPALVPFIPFAWLNPQLRPQSNRGYLNQVELQLLGQDQFFGPPGVGPRYDWPNPQRAKRVQVGGTWSWTFPITLPIGEGSWPARVQSGRRGYGWTDSFKLELLGPVVNPPVGSWQQMPMLRMYYNRGQVRGHNLKLFELWQPQPSAGGVWGAEGPMAGSWSVQGQLTGSWTKQARQSSGWTKESPASSTWTKEEPEER